MRWASKTPCYTTREKYAAGERLLKRKGLDGFLPGLTINRHHVDRLLDLYELAHFQMVYGVTLDASVFARIHPVPSQGVSFKNYGILLARLFEFSREIGIEITWTEKGGGHGLGKFAFTDPEKVTKRTSELLDSVAVTGSEEDDEQGEQGEQGEHENRRAA